MQDGFAEELMSVIVPVGSRCGSMADLYREYRDALTQAGLSCEFIFVLDGPNPAELAKLRRLGEAGEPVTIVELTRPFGEATALMAGSSEAAGRRLMSLPSYYQVDPGELPRLVHALHKADLVIAHRTPRAGNWFEHIRRRVFHALLSVFTRHQFRDLGCGARAMDRSVLSEMQPYGDQARFLPVLAERLGFRVVELDVRQSPLDRRKGGYEPRDYARGLLDILTMLFITRFTKKPLRFFGMIGLAMFAIGAVLIGFIVFERLVLREPLAERPALLLSSLVLVLGSQLFGLGLLGELLIFTHGSRLKDFQIAEVIRHKSSAVPAEPQPRQQ